MEEYSSISDWEKPLNKWLLEGISTAVGVFNNEGCLLDANRAMCYFLDASDDSRNARNSFVNPDFSDFATNHTEGMIFEGLLTIGNFGSTSYTLDAKVFRRNQFILVFAEANVPQLFSDNKKMSQLNQEVNNLQRQLIREKMNLQNALKELKDTQQMLVHSEKMNAMGKLVAGVAHEINNPISFVYSNMFSMEKYIDEILQSYSDLENAVKTSANPEMIKLADEFRERNDLDFLFNDLVEMTKESKIGLDRVKIIVEDLRKFSRLDEAEMKTIDLIDNIASTISIASFELSNRNIRYQIEAPDKLMVTCFPGQLNQALLNVVINAAQAIGKNGNIRITVSEQNTKVQLIIQDDGCGIPESIRSRIFEPFFTTKPVGSGTGLGLSITYKIITDLHKGSIEVISSEGEGSSFVISIPKMVEQLIK